MFWLVLGWCLVFDVQQVNFGADLRVALAADWVFLVGSTHSSGMVLKARMLCASTASLKLAHFTSEERSP